MARFRMNAFSKPATFFKPVAVALIFAAVSIAVSGCASNCTTCNACNIGKPGSEPVAGGQRIAEGVPISIDFSKGIDGSGNPVFTADVTFDDKPVADTNYIVQSFVYERKDVVDDPTREHVVAVSHATHQQQSTDAPKHMTFNVEFGPLPGSAADRRVLVIVTKKSTGEFTWGTFKLN